MKRILLTIAYDGTNYSGWQKQKDEAVITVEGELTRLCGCCSAILHWSASAQAERTQACMPWGSVR